MYKNLKISKKIIVNVSLFVAVNKYRIANTYAHFALVAPINQHKIYNSNEILNSLPTHTGKATLYRLNLFINKLSQNQ